MQETQVQSLGQEDPLEKGMATHSSILSCLENPMVRAAWWATVCGAAKSQTQLSDFHFQAHFSSSTCSLKDAKSGSIQVNMLVPHKHCESGEM